MPRKRLLLKPTSQEGHLSQGATLPRTGKRRAEARQRDAGCEGAVSSTPTSNRAGKATTLKQEPRPKRSSCKRMRGIPLILRPQAEVGRPPQRVSAQESCDKSQNQTNIRKADKGSEHTEQNGGMADESRQRPPQKSEMLPNQ